ncbi:hypothetical protein cyc_02272 [Cyclospora cayetanensis]|uniref:Uncharacterized protein n=1 Tax=Cyclospora cayetanensis TaxID=88456 RepID=A0A1D3D4M6_9EIME|nr:hypothetical protein cyc_02272 [Cyclospora cayetanensis]
MMHADEPLDCPLPAATGAGEGCCDSTLTHCKDAVSLSPSLHWALHGKQQQDLRLTLLQQQQHWGRLQPQLQHLSQRHLLEQEQERLRTEEQRLRMPGVTRHSVSVLTPACSNSPSRTVSDVVDVVAAAASVRYLELHRQQRYMLQLLASDASAKAYAAFEWLARCLLSSRPTDVQKSPLLGHL